MYEAQISPECAVKEAVDKVQFTKNKVNEQNEENDINDGETNEGIHTTAAKNGKTTARSEGMNMTGENNDRTGARYDIHKKDDETKNETREDDCEENIENDKKSKFTEINGNSHEFDKSEKVKRVSKRVLAHKCSIVDTSDIDNTMRRVLLSHKDKTYRFEEIIDKFGTGDANEQGDKRQMENVPKHVNDLGQGNILFITFRECYSKQICLTPGDTLAGA